MNINFDDYQMMLECLQRSLRHYSVFEIDDNIDEDEDEEDN